MVANTTAWVSALSSDSEDDDRPPNRSAAESEVAEQDVFVVEDDDVRILNVLKTEPGGDDSVRQTFDNELPGSQPNAGGHPEVFQFAATEESTKQQSAVVSERQKKKNEARQQRRIRAALRRKGNDGNGAGIQLTSSEVSERREQGAQVKGLPSATTGLGFIDMERLVAGNNTRDWCHSLRMCQGPELSNLHWNVVRFCDSHELSAEQIAMRRDALEYVKQAVFEIWPCAEVHLFGSTATGLALPWSDIDVAVMSPVQSSTWQKPSTMSWLSALSRNLKRHGRCQKIRQIPFAKVPLLKVVFNSGIACDISFDVPNGPRGVPVIRQFMQHYEPLRPLCLVLKFFLGQKDLNELYTGGIGSFCLINMVVSLLQNLGVSGTDHDLGVLLQSFFTHFSVMHNYRTDVVCTRPGYCAPKHVRGWVKFNDPELLSCEDPLDPTSDIAKGSYRIHDAKKAFFKAKTALLAHWHDEDVLSQLIDASQPPLSKPQKQQKLQQNQQDLNSAHTPGGKKKQKQKNRKMKNQGVTSGDEEDAPSKRARKKQKLNGKAVEQVSDSKRRRLSTVNRPAKLQKKKKKQKVERIHLDFWGNQVNTKQRRTGKAARKGIS